jgi:hypothetical protein
MVQNFINLKQARRPNNMKTNTLLKPTNHSGVSFLSKTHLTHMTLGGQHRERLRDAVDRSINKKSKRDFYIFSPPGLGKTYTVEDEFKKQGITPVRIEGNTSLFGFVVDLAMIVSLRKPGQHIYLFIDDCDNLLLHKDSVNTLKIALSKNILNYNKALTAQYNQLNEDQQYALDQFRVQGRNGVEIPLDNMTIIWCSNYKLADTQDVAKCAKHTTKWQKFTDEEALRRRLNARDYDVEGNTKWGWIADCIINETPPALATATKQQLEHIVVWMFDHWNVLKEHNISFAEKLYEEMQYNPDEYTSFWEYDYTTIGKK